MFAPPAVVGGVVYAGDLNGVVHAIDLADGAGKWKLDLATDPAVKAPGMIYGGPACRAAGSTSPPATWPTTARARRPPWCVSGRSEQ